MARNQFSKILPYFLIISSYVFGIICIQFAVWPQLVNLTWFQMMLSCGLILYTYPQTNKNSILIFFIVSYFVGFIVEIIGVQSGLLFGTYYYGEVLGWKILDTPIVIGINWFLVTYAVNQLVDFLKLNKLGHSFVAASAITALDYLIEPDAIKLGMWTWAQESIPIKNYIAWWVISFGLSLFYHRLVIKKHTFALVVLGLMILFFGIQ